MPKKPVNRHLNYQDVMPGPMAIALRNFEKRAEECGYMNVGCIVIHNDNDNPDPNLAGMREWLFTVSKQFLTTYNLPMLIQILREWTKEAEKET